MKGNAIQSRHRFSVALLLAAFVLLMSAEYAAAKVNGAIYMYNLSDFTGVIPYNWSALSVDKERNEIYVIYKNEVEVFNEKGMKIYSFGDDENLRGVIADVTVGRDGTIFLLLSEGDIYSVVRCNYRGEPVAPIDFRNFPGQFSKFLPGRIIYRNGDLYLADLVFSKKVVITDSDGVYKDGYELDSILALKDIEGKPGQEKEIAGFSLDRDGNMLFTVPTIFKAFKVSSDRKVQMFGEAGNIPGKFSVVAGITSDDAGNYYVTDTLKSVVMVYDRDFNFIFEFGYRGDQPGNLIAPRNMVVNDGYLYVSQSRKRGVSVYRILQD
ncbi:MAG: hypothetical protein HZB61_16085 [Nitrospirae bacterium]|nr:hypothetical protein [Nitrospirota bacterium]